MSPYMIDKFLRWLPFDRSALAEFCVDRRSVVERWITDDRTAEQSALPYSLERGSLTPEAVQALVDLDLRGLYEMGAHPYVLWHFAVDVYTADGRERAWIMDHYKTAIGESGYPSFAT